MPEPPSGSSFGLMRSKDGSIWAYQPTAPDGYIQLAAPPGSQSVAMNSAVAVSSGDTLGAGYWVLVFNPGIGGVKNIECQLIKSDGTTPSPEDGNAYLLALEAAT